MVSNGDNVTARALDTVAAPSLVMQQERRRQSQRRSQQQYLVTAVEKEQIRK